MVNRNGLLTGHVHFGEAGAMQKLLEAEGINVIDNQIVKFKQLFWDPGEELSL